jgi:tRNA A64-2'-O-ribosylphosphate transferase
MDGSSSSLSASICPPSAVVDVPGLSNGLLVCNQQMSITQVLRHVKRSEHSIANCIASIVHDSKVVEKVYETYDGRYHVYGNRRCGVWYTNPEILGNPEKTCYFKSTDGHVNQWSFSLTRLNLHVALDAVEHGGCIIVDATRRGKMWPDALSKTVPIWAAVVNTAVQVYQADHDLEMMDDSDTGVLHLPDWVPEHERWQIEKRIDGWAMQLVDSGVDLHRLAQIMKKPLVCCWVHSSDLNDPMLHDNNPMLVLVSVSNHESRERKLIHLVKEVCDTCCTEDEETVEFVFDYIPGAGDDEESWSMGLSPDNMWRHYHEILLQEDDTSRRKFIQRLVISQKHAASEDVAESRISWFSDSKLGIASHAHLSQNRSMYENIAVVNVGGHDVASDTLVWDPTMITEPCECITAGGMMSQDNKILQLVGKERQTMTKYLYLGEKKGKFAIVECAPAAVEFASWHLEEGRHVCFVYDDSSSASVATALLLGTIIACFDLPEEEFVDGILWKKTHMYSIDSEGKCIRPAPHGFSRSVFRRYVANRFVFLDYIQFVLFTDTHSLIHSCSVGQYFSQVIMRKTVLKQVFNLFIPSTRQDECTNE